MRIEHLAATALVAVFMLIGCSGDDAVTAPRSPSLAVQDAGHNAADHFSSTTPLDETLVSPCNGETIHLTGSVFEQVTYVDTRQNLDNGGSLHTEHQGVISESGTGLTSGASYAFHDNFHESFESPSAPAPNYVIAFRETGRVTSTTPGLSFTFRFVVHLVQLPSGEFKLTKTTDSVECR